MRYARHPGHLLDADRLRETLQGTDVPEHHPARFVLLTCIDERYEEVRKKITDLLEDGLIVGEAGKAFSPALAGSALNFVVRLQWRFWKTIEQWFTRRLAMRQISLPKKINGTSTIILKNHLACGAYADVGYKFCSRDEEIQVHTQHLLDAGSYIHKQLQGSLVILLLVDAADVIWAWVMIHADDTSQTHAGLMAHPTSA